MNNTFIRSIGTALALCVGAAAYGTDVFPDGTTVYGYKASGSKAYFYELSPTASTQMWEDTGYKSSWYVKLASGWLNDGKFEGYRVDNSGANLYDLFFVEIDWETGELINSKTLKTNAGFMSYAALDPATRTIYGYGYNSAKNLAFMSASLDSPDAFTTIKEVEETEVCYGITWNSTDGILAGILGDGTLVSIAADGTQTEILKTNFRTSSSGIDSYTRSQPLAWSASEKVYYWNAEAPNLEDEYLWTINPETKAVSNYSGYEGGMYTFIMTGQNAAADAPKAPELVAFNFAGGASDGNVVIKMPSETIGGGDLTGPLTWKACIDGEEKAAGSAQPGEEVTATFSDVADGMRAFSFSVAAGEFESPVLSFAEFIGIDTPKAPQNVALTHTLLSWDAVTEGVNGGYIDLANLKYEIYLDGESLGVTTETSYAVDLPETGQLKSVKATVYAVCGELRSEAGESNPVDVGSAFMPPVELAPTPGEAVFFKTIDGYDDSRSWTFNADAGYFQSGYNETNQMDEWLVLPPVELKAGGHYNFSFETNRKSNFFAEEYLEIGFGTAVTAESLSSTILKEKFQVPYNREGFTVVETQIDVTETGIYYIGLHCVSDADMINVFVKNFSIVNTGMEAVSPDAVTDLTAVAAEGGELKATVTFTLPVKTIEGEDIEETAVISAKVECVNEVTVEGKPGKTLTATVETEQGENTITVTTSIGETAGKKATVKVFTGEAIPGKVNNLTIAQSADFKSLTLSWEAPTEGYDGGFINPANLTYTVRILKSTAVGDLWDDLAVGLTETSYVFTTDVEALDYYSFAVLAAGPSGISPVAAENGGVLGTPYSLPMVEDFSAQNVYTYQPWVTYLPSPDYATRWGVLPVGNIPEVYDAPGEWALCGMGMSAGCHGLAGFPVFSTAGLQNVTLSFMIWTGVNAASNIHVTGEVYGMTEPVMVGTVVAADGEDWQTCEFELPAELTDSQWVKLYLNADFPDGSAQWVVMPQYSIDETSGLRDIAAGQTVVVAKDGSIIVESPDAVEVSVYNVSGAVVAVSPAAVDHNIKLPAGLYIVRAGEKTVKIALR